MSKINYSTPTTISKYNGEYTLSAKPESGYVIIGIDQTTAETPQESSTWDSVSISGTALTNAGMFNNGYYGSSSFVTTSVTVEDNELKYRIRTRPRSYGVTYARNHDSTDNEFLYKYTDQDSRPNSDTTGFERQDLTSGDHTYSYHASVLAGNTSNFTTDTGWSAPSHKHFIGWNTERTATSAMTFDFSTYVFTGDLTIYAIYADDDQYSVNVYFDSTEINGDNITLT